MEAFRKNEDDLEGVSAQTGGCGSPQIERPPVPDEAARLILDGLLHEQDTPYVERPDGETVAIRIRARSRAVSGVDLAFRRESASGGSVYGLVAMEPYATEGVFTHYRGEVQVSDGVLLYRFVLRPSDVATSGGNAGSGGVLKVWCTPSGVFLREPDPNDWYTLDVSRLRVFRTPEWVHDAVFYQIFPDRFANGDPTNDPPGTRPWGEPPTRDNFFGGDFQGIIEKIPYLRDLGITAVWLNPIFQSVSNHKYDTADYMRVDASFGDLAKFRELVEAFHAAGIRVVLDGVFNHTGDEFWAFQDIVEKGPASPYVNWYHVHGFPVRRSPKPNYETWWGFADLPKLNMGNPEVRAYILNVVTFWMREAGIDGWRLDVPNEIDHSFWKVFRDHVKSINPDAYIVGEIWQDGTPWLKGDEFDAVMNYVFRDAVLDFFARKKASASELVATLERLRAHYPHQASAAQLNLLGSHDTERVLTAFHGDKRRMIPAVVFQMAYLGAPMVYYGDEVGMVGEKDPGCRGTMVWDESLQDRELLGLYRRLVRVRRRSAALRRGNVRWLLVDDSMRTFAFARTFGRELAVVAVCAGEKQVTLDLDLAAGFGEEAACAPWSGGPRGDRCAHPRGDSFWDAITGRVVPSKGGRVRLEQLGPHQAAILLLLSSEPDEGPT